MERLRRFLFLEPRAKAPPPAGSGLELAEPSDEQPFTRCASCGMDNQRAAARCVNCARALDTEEQRAFSRRLWEELRAARAAEEAAARAPAPLPPELVRAVEEERALDEPALSPGARLLQLIPDPRARAVAVPALVASMLGWTAWHHSPLGVVGLVSLLALFHRPRR